MIGIKEFNKKIGSLKNTRKMTKTMKMVSASKFKRAHKAQGNALAYARKLQELMGRLSTGSSAAHPLMKPQLPVKNILMVVFTSDKGLCGGFNNNLIRKLRHWLTDNQANYNKISLSFCGRRGYMSFRRSSQVLKFYENVTTKPNVPDALTVAKDISEAFLKGEYQEIYLVYNKFHGPISQEPTIEKILPLNPQMLSKPGEKSSGPMVDYEYEPEPEEMFVFLVPKFLNFKIYFTLLENAAGEHGARMSAMDKASQNTSDLIDRYTLLRNRARQAAITTELIEIISGAEALK